MGKYVIESKFENTRCFLEVACENREPYFFINSVDSLTPYTEPDLEQVRKEAYKEGREAGIKDGMCDAWEAARKIALDKEDGGLDTAAYCETFGYGKGFGAVLKTYTASEAIEKIRQYEQEKEEQIQVGDEVISPDGKGVVTEISDRIVRIMYAKGSGQVVKLEDLTKTDRHFPEIAEVLQKMRES